MEVKTKYCSNCGAQIDANAEICPKCGVRIFPAPTLTRTLPVERKSEGIAAVLSFFIPGLGQIYNGQISKGLVMIIAGFFIALSMILLIGLILYPIYWIWNIYDAYSTAKKINAGIV